MAVRDASRAGPVREVADHLGLQIRLAGFAAEGVTLAAARQAWQLLISTVPAGAADVVARQVAAGDVAAEAVFDVVYEPWPTLLAQAAMAAGSTVISGFELLLQQAAAQVELMTGRQAPVAAMRAAGLAEIARRRERSKINAEERETYRSRADLETPYLRASWARKLLGSGGTDHGGQHRAEYSAVGMSYACLTTKLGSHCRACKRRTTSAASHLASTVTVSQAPTSAVLTDTAPAGI